MADARAVPDPTAPHRDRFAPLPPERAALWSQFGQFGRILFPNLVGLRLEEARTDYARMRLVHRPEIEQPAGVVHGGAIATLVDTVVVPAIASAYEERPVLLTVDMHLQYLGAVRKQDAVAEGWVEKRGRSIVFCRVEVRDASGELAASASLVYRVIPPRDARAS